ncbi:MAG: InlB B-repeat-containing protein, partial [Eubacterium sp.]
NSNTNSWWGTKYTWDAEPKVISPVVKDTPVITIDKKGSADEVSNMAAGIGWAKVSATYDGKATGNRSMRFVPTTVLSLGGQTGMDIGKDKIIYPTIPNAAQKEKRYDHVDGVTFVKATASELNNSPGSIRPSGFPAGDKYTNVGVTCGVTTGKVTVTLEKTDSSGKKTTIALNGTDAESLRYQRLFNGLEDFTAADLGVYKLTYSWQVSNSDVKTILTNSKTLTVRTPLQLTYDMNLPKDETAPADVVVDNLKVNQQITSLQAPTRTGYTFVEWNTKEDGTGSKITAPYTMQDNVTFYAKWQANKYTVTFDYDDVTTGLTDVVVKDIEYKGTVGDKYPSAPAMEENVGGKIFYGWSANPLAENVVYFDANTEVTDNITLHPVWHNGEHTVTFIDKDGTTVGTPQIIKHGENAKA